MTAVKNPEQMRRCLRPWWAIAAAFVLGLTGNVAQADLVKLMNGGELRGKVIQSSSKQTIQFETLTGATIVVDREQTEFVTLRSLKIEEYETRARRIPGDNPDWKPHWELAEWCRQHGLKSQRDSQLLKVVEVLPDHEKAQLALGRTWNKGNWIDRDELMASQGFVKYKNKYVTRQELEILERSADDLQREKAWIQKVRLWHGWLDGSDQNRYRQAIDEFESINDPHAASAIVKFLTVDSRSQVRQMAATILVRVGGISATSGLVNLALFDESPDVRTIAFEGIGRDFFKQARIAFIQALRNPSNVVVCRAATALGQIGDKTAVLPLIDALITIHSYQVVSDIPLNPTYSFGTDGSFSNGLPPSVVAAVRTGQMQAPIVIPSSDTNIPKKTVTIRVEHYNSDVLNALEKLTKKSFGFDKRTWNLWWTSEKIHNPPVGK